MSSFFDGVGTFADHLAAVQWRFLAIALVFHLGKVVAITVAWRNIVAAAYPSTSVRWPRIFGSYVAGAGVNALVPARTGDLVKLYIAKRQVEGSTYTTLASTLVALTIFDLAAASLIFLWAVHRGVLPGVDVLPHLPRFDLSWVFAHPRATAVLALVLLVAAVALVVWALRRISAFRRRVGQGFAVLRDPRAYLRGVALWQAIDWTLRIIALYWFLRAFGIAADAHNAFLVQVTQSLSTIFPFSPGGIGTEQALVLYVLAGEAATSALLAFSVGTKLTIILANVALGSAAIALMLRTIRWRRVVIDARTSAPRREVSLRRAQTRATKLAASGERP